MSKIKKSSMYDHADLKDLLAKQDLWKGKAEEVATDLRKYFDEELGDNLTAPKLLARLIAEFDLNDFPKAEVNIGELYLEWTVREYMIRKGPGLLKYIEFIYQKLVEHDFKLDQDKDGRYEWNDLDNHMWYVPHNKFNVFCITTQNLNWLIIHQHDEDDPCERNQFAVYRYWDKIADSNYDHKELMEEIEKGDSQSLINYMMEHASWQTERYSDNVKGNQYISRPDFQWLADQDFDPEKIRENCFIRSTFNHCESPTNLNWMRDEPSIHSYGLIKGMAFDIACAYGEAKDLEGDEK